MRDGLEIRKIILRFKKNQEFWTKYRNVKMNKKKFAEIPIFFSNLRLPGP